MHLASLISINRLYEVNYAQKNIFFKNFYILPSMPDSSILTQFTVDIYLYGK
jgi:hypothetical protein